MTKNILKGFVFLFVLLIALPAFSEINLSPTAKKVEVLSAGAVVATLDEATPESTIKDSTGGVFEAKFDVAGQKVDITAVSGKSTLTMGIATITLSEDSSCVLNYSQDNKLAIKNASEDSILQIAFPDSSRADLNPNAEILLTMAADQMWYIRVLAESVEFSEVNGYKRTLTTSSPEKVIRGFTKTPWWRKIEWLHPYDSASSMTHTDYDEAPVTP